LPFGVIGIAVSTALLPMLSSQLRAGNVAVALHTQNRALELSLLFGLPATIALMVIPYPIVTVIYEHGAFTPGDTQATFVTLIAFAVGLPASLAVKIFASTFYANQDTRTPVKIAMLCVAVNLCLNLALMGPMKYVGLALSTSIANWVNAACLAASLHRRRLFIADTLLKFRVIRMTLAALIMGALLWAACIPLGGYFHAILPVKILALAALIAAGMLFYGGSLLALRVLSPTQLREYFRKR
jgi:putative peptidoglycan lipid II flippase